MPSRSAIFSGWPSEPIRPSIGSRSRSVFEIRFLLPAVRVERLAKITLGIQEPDSDQRNSQVTGAFEVITSKHAQTSRINRQAFVQSKLGRKVGHRARTQNRRVDCSPRVGVLEILGQPPEGVVDTRVSAISAARRSSCSGGSRLRNSTGLWSTFRQSAGSSSRKQRDDVGLPDPPHIAGQVTKLVNQLRLTNQGLTPSQIADREPRHERCARRTSVSLLGRDGRSPRPRALKDS